MAAVVSNKKGVNYPDAEGVVNDTVSRKWSIRFGETDKDTRGNRSDRKASVTTLTPKLAIVNVYELINKRSRRLAERGRKPKGSSGTSTGEKKAKGINPGEYGFMLPAVDEYDGVMVNAYGNPVTKDEESRGEYNPRVAKWRRDHNFAGNVGHELYVKGKKPSAESQGNKKQEAKKSQEEEEVEDKDKRKFKEKQQAAQDESERLVAEQRAKQPPYILLSRSDALNVYSSPTESRYEMDPAYSRRDPEEDFDFLMRVISGLQKDKILPRKKDDIKNPPIVMIQTTKSKSVPPRAFYVRNDISYRRRKGSKVQVKRLPMKKIPQGNKKRKVVMRKGGKR